jgi:glucosyl-dolichyl phosphate glucuronosyltransferase
MYARDISVVICAYTEDRWDQVCAAIDSVRAQSLPSNDVIVVVDHNRSLFERLAATVQGAGDVRVAENREAKGLSGARNTGSALARGEIVAFLDDDAVAHPDWLKFLTDAYADPSVAGVGGLTVPDWQRARPAWMPEEFYWVVGSSYLGMPPSGAPVRNLLGANMSFRREVFDLVDGFRTGIGRTSGKRPLGCEETEFCIRLGQRAPGSLLVMENRAVVSHFVPDSRCTFSYFLARCYAEGISKAQVTASVGSADGLASERSYVTRTLPAGVAKGVADVFRGRASGLARAGAIVAGLGMTTLGFLGAKVARTASGSKETLQAQAA